MARLRAVARARLSARTRFTRGVPERFKAKDRAPLTAYGQ